MHPRSTFLVLVALVPAAAGCRDDATSPTGPTTAKPAAAAGLAVASNTWVTRKDLETDQYTDFATATVTDASGRSVLYVIGGRAGNLSPFTESGLAKVMAYDVTTNRWTVKASLPEQLHSTNGAGVINGKIYVSGGVPRRKTYRDVLYVYDPATNAWASKRRLPITGYRGVTGVIDGKLYVVTSCHGQEDCLYYDDYQLPVGHPDRWLFRYNPRTDTWTELAIPPGVFGSGGPGTMGMGGTIGGKLYVGNGQSNILLVYDPVTNTWTEKATPRALRIGAAFATLGARLYMVGGVRINADGTYSEVRTTNAYDPTTNTWTNLAPLPTPRSWIAGDPCRRERSAPHRAGGRCPSRQQPAIHPVTRGSPAYPKQPLSESYSMFFGIRLEASFDPRH